MWRPRHTLSLVWQIPPSDSLFWPSQMLLSYNTWIISTTNLVKTGRYDFSLSWHKGAVRENLGDFQTACMYFNISFPATACPPTFQKTNLLHNNLKKDAINKFGIKYWKSNPTCICLFSYRHEYFYHWGN